MGERGRGSGFKIRGRPFLALAARYSWPGRGRLVERPDGPRRPDFRTPDFPNSRAPDS